MKIYMDPLPKTCSTCNLGRRVIDNAPWYTCFITGKTCTSITTERPEWCPIEAAEGEGITATEGSDPYSFAENNKEIK